MKAPDHPTPSGDRRIARLTLRALEATGHAPFVASDLRILDMAGDRSEQRRLETAAAAEVRRLTSALGEYRPVAWFTYHCHYKTPDLIGPEVAESLGIPYLLSEPSIAPKRRTGPWAGFCAAAEAAIARADRLFWTTARDRPALEAAGLGPKMTHLPAFLEPGPPPPPRPARRPLHLLAVAMMRPGHKAESYRRLAAALDQLGHPWRLTLLGAGEARDAVLAEFARFGERVEAPGAIEDPAALRAHYEAADLLAWPGVEEGVGMAWLEAQAAGLPVVAEDGPAARAVVGAGHLVPADEPRAFAAAITAAAAERAALSARATAHIARHHSIERAAAILKDALTEAVR